MIDSNETVMYENGRDTGYSEGYEDGFNNKIETICPHPTEVITLFFNSDNMDTETVSNMVEHLQDKFPTNTVVALPDKVDLETVDVPYVYNCNKKTLYPPKNFITYNIITDENDKYKNEVQVDECLANEIEELWSKGIKTCGCCCGHGFTLGFIEVTNDCIEDMEKLGYVHYIYPANLGGVERKDAFVPKTYGHIHNGYSHGFIG